MIPKIRKFPGFRESPTPHNSCIGPEINRVTTRSWFGNRGANHFVEQPAHKGIGNMKLKSLFTAVMVFAIPALAFAAPKNSANVNLDQTVKVAGTQLAPGQYRLVWEGTGP